MKESFIFDIEEVNHTGINFKVWVDSWDTDFLCYDDAVAFCRFAKYNYDYKTLKIEVRVTQVIRNPGKDNDFKDHIIATILF